MDILLGKTVQELEAVALELGLPKFVGKQLAQWLYQKRVSDFAEMTNLSLKAREMLAQQYLIGRSEPLAHADSVDGTIKYLFAQTTQRSDSKEVFETVFLPEADRTTLCVSTQAGCKMGCRFCMTGTLGFHTHLTATDILNQIFYCDQASGSGLTNVVFMGEGEPMDNLEAVLRAIEILTADWGLGWSPKRITVSSVGLIPELKHFLDSCDAHLAISLHNPFSAERQQIMPIEKRYPIAEVIAFLKTYDFSHQRRVSFEYICWGGVNDTPRHAKELLRLLNGVDCRVNLIRFHAGVDQHFPASDEPQMIWMRDYLTSKGLTTTIRKSRGEDILAACGMLVNDLSS